MENTNIKVHIFIVIINPYYNSVVKIHLIGVITFRIDSKELIIKELLR